MSLDSELLSGCRTDDTVWNETLLLLEVHYSDRGVVTLKIVDHEVVSELVESSLDGRDCQL